MKTRTWTGIMTVLLAACSTQAVPTPTLVPSPSRPSPTPPPTATPVITPTAETGTAELQGLPLVTARNDLFSGSGACAPCHANMTDEAGADVSIDSAWRSTTMANAARDPYWQASVSAEVDAIPELRAAIEDTCATCHMPMARFSETAEGGLAPVLADGLLDPEDPLHPLAMDGVSCTLCHQIRDTNLGPQSYSGRFVIDAELPPGERLIFGPFTIEEQQAQIMQIASGFLPAQALPYGRGLHISQSELCATCHVLYTPYVDASGQIAGEFPEQVTYLEWFYSDYRSTTTCQQCHMPSAEGGVRIASTSTTLRSPFSQHLFGGNPYMLDMLRTYGEELGVTASGAQLEASIAHAADLLQNDTARLTLEEVNLSGQRLTVNVLVENIAGHRFPTSFPSRRAWLHFVVRAADGQVVFESGAVNPDGSIVGNDNDADPTTYEQHYQAIINPEQVQIYEAILRDTEADVTTTLLRAAGYLKDNRLTASGYQKTAPYADIAVHGEAVDDENFIGGSDWIQYSFAVGQAPQPLTVTVELLYQSIGYRWAQNLGMHATAEVERFLDYYDRLPNTPVVIASQTTEVGN